MSGLRYDGNFELRWLRRWQAVSSAGDGSGACIVYDLRNGRQVRINLGDDLIAALADVRRGDGCEALFRIDPLRAS